MYQYDVGDKVRVRGSFENLEGNPIDPTAVFFKSKNPSGLITTYECSVSKHDAQLVHETVGQYYVDIDLDHNGEWWVRFYSTGTGKAAEEQLIQVKNSEF